MTVADVRASALEGRLETLRLRHGVPGVAVSIWENGRPAFSRTAGYASLAPRRLATRNTLFAAGSITKLLAATAMLRASELGLVALDAPISRLLGCGDWPLGDVRVSQLLSHTSGIEVETAPRPHCADGVDRVLDDIAASHSPMPGESWAYCNTNYYLVACILEKVFGRSFEATLNDIAIPSILRGRLFGTRPKDRSAVAVGYAKTTSGVGATDFPGAEHAFGTGTVYGTADALASWMSMLWRGEIIGPDSTLLMSTPFRLSNGTVLSYGLGCFVSEIDGLVEFSHDGNTEGYTSQLAYYPAHRLAICVLANSSAHVAEEIARAVLRTWVGEELQAAPPSEPEENGDVGAYAGHYARGDRSAVVSSTGSGLTIRTSSGRSTILRRAAEHCFAEVDMPGLRYTFEPAGDAMRLRVERHGKLLAVLQRTDGA